MQTTTATIARHDLLQMADALARERGIDREEVFQVMELAIQKAGKAQYGLDQDIRVHISRRNGEVELSRCQQVVETVEDPATQISLEEAQSKNPQAHVGEILSESLPPIEFGRVVAQAARQVIHQKVKEAERVKQYNEYKDRVGEVIIGLVKRSEFGNVIVDLGRTEAIITKDHLIPRETFRVGDRVKAYIYDVRLEARGPQVFLSRTQPQFMARLFAQEVPEINDGIIRIQAIARDPGSRSKIGVLSYDSSIDPVGSCVGLRGSRVQGVVNELQGEKVDIILWSEDPATFAANALAPAEVTKIVLDEDQHKIEVVVPDDQLSLAIGRRGQNVRLASQLTGWSIDISTESEDALRRQEEMHKKSHLFIEALDVDEVIAQLLVAEGFSTVEELALAHEDDLLAIEGFDQDLIQELQERARSYQTSLDAEAMEMFAKLGGTPELAALQGLKPAMLVALARNNVRTPDDLGDLATEELLEILQEQDVSEAQANALIMSVRAHWFEEPETQS